MLNIGKVDYHSINTHYNIRQMAQLVTIKLYKL